MISINKYAIISLNTVTYIKQDTKGPVRLYQHVYKIINNHTNYDMVELQISILLYNAHFIHMSSRCLYQCNLCVNTDGFLSRKV